MEFVMEPFMWLGIVALFLVIEAVTVGQPSGLQVAL